MTELAPLIAVVGCDGSGKSTLAADLLAHIKKTRAAERSYLGLGSGAMGNKIKAWPIIGKALEGFLSNRANRARDPKDKIPGILTALVLYGFSLRRKAKFEQVLALRRSGITVVTDRYPQTEVAGFYDGPGLSAARADGWLIGKLAAKERIIYEWMASHIPTLVIRLHVDVETAMQRKPDHARALIEKKVAATPLLKFNNAPIFDLDATSPYASEITAAIAATNQVLR